MSTDTAQINLKEPEQCDWDSLGKSAYQAPPPAMDANGNVIVYYGVAEGVTETDADEGYLQVLIDPIKIVRSVGSDGYKIRFTRASTRPFTKGADKTPIKGNPNKIGNFLRAAGVQAKPQTNSEYRASINAAKTKTFGFTVDWNAYNKDTGEKVDGYMNFPEDPERPGQRKSILKAGDVVTERSKDGTVTATRTVTSEVLFANARLKYFRDATPKVGK